MATSAPAPEYPASTHTPRYLTGDGAGIREFIDKFDVSHIISSLSCIWSACSTEWLIQLLGLPLRLRWFVPSYHIYTTSVLCRRLIQPGILTCSWCRRPLVRRSYLPWHKRDPRDATEQRYSQPTNQPYHLTFPPTPANRHNQANKSSS